MGGKKSETREEMRTLKNALNLIILEYDRSGSEVNLNRSMEISNFLYLKYGCIFDVGNRGAIELPTSASSGRRGRRDDETEVDGECSDCE